MSEALQELLFWTVVFVVFFFGAKKLQKRSQARKAAAKLDKTRSEDQSDT